MKKHIEYVELFRELEMWERGGAKLFFDDEEVTAFQIVQSYMINEDLNYMRDYIRDEDGNVCEIRFDKIN